MLTINNFKKLEGLVLKDGLKVIGIADIGDAYSIWLSDNSNIELDRNMVHNISNIVPIYRMFIGYKGGPETEFVSIRTINTLDRMREQLICIHDKYKTK
jgi:hypothetical protein